MGMRQRLAIAAALLGDPEVLILDEPANGLDPPGIRWMRELLRAQAGRGRAVLVSSHLLAEVAQSVDELVVISHGALRASGPLQQVLGAAQGEVTRVRAADNERLAAVLRERGITVEEEPSRRPARARHSARGRGPGRGRPSAGARRAGRGVALARGRLLRAHPGRSVTRLLEAELIKLRTTRTFAALAGVAVAMSLLITVLVSILSEPSQDDVLTDVFTSDASGLFILILAVLGITGEWRHRTITSSLLAAPDRLRFLAAKTLAFAAAGVVLSLLIAIAVGVVGFAILTIRDLPTPGLGEWIEQVARNALVAALLGAFGVALGGLVRNQAVAIVGVLVIIFVVDSAVTSLLPDVGRFSPFSALPTAAAGLDPADQAGLTTEWTCSRRPGRAGGCWPGSAPSSRSAPPC